METSTLFLIVLVIIIIFFFSSMKITFSTSSNNNTKDYTKSESESATQKSNTLVDSPSMAVSLAGIQNKFYYNNMRYIPNP
jgi:hypothetical protein